MIAKIVTIGRLEAKLNEQQSANMRKAFDAVDSATEVRRAVPLHLQAEFESVLSLFEDDGTFIRSYEY